MVDPLRSEGFNVRWQFRIVEKDLVRSCLPRCLLLCWRPDRANDVSTGVTRQLDRA